MLTHLAADGDHELRDDVTVVDLHCLDRAVEHSHAQDTLLLLVLQ